MTLSELFKSIADAIRGKEGSTDSIPATDFASRIEAIETSVTPTISVSSSGLITATSGDKSSTKQLTTQAAKTVTPGTSSKTAVSSGIYTTGAITVAGDSNLVAANIKSGVSIFGVTGTVEDGWEKVQFMLEGSGEASLSTNIYGSGVFYIDFASPISDFCGLSIFYEYDCGSGYQSYAASIVPGFSDNTFIGMYHNFDWANEDSDGFISGTEGDGLYDWGITASLASSTRIKVDMNELGNWLMDSSDARGHYGTGTVFVKYV